MYFKISQKTGILDFRYVITMCMDTESLFFMYNRIHIKYVVKSEI